MTISSDITIGVPTYKRPAMLEEALRSLVSQTLVPRIVVHDNCEQGSGKPVSRQFEKVQYRKHDTNLGSLANFASLVQACETEYFGWLQDDDVLFSNCIEEFRDCFAKRSEITCSLAYALNARQSDRVERNGVPLFGPPGGANWTAGVPTYMKLGEILPWCLVRSVGFSPVALFRRDLLVKALAEVKTLDFGIFWERAILSSLSASGEVGVVPKILGILRRHEKSASCDYLREALTNGAASHYRTLHNLETFIDSKFSTLADPLFEHFRRELKMEPVEDVREFYHTSKNFRTNFGMKVFEVCRETLLAMRELPSPPHAANTAMVIRRRASVLAWEVLPPFVSKMIQRMAALK